MTKFFGVVSTHVMENKFIKNFVWQPERNRWHRRYSRRHILRRNIKINL